MFLKNVINRKTVNNESKDESNIFFYAEILADITIWGCGQINRFDSAIFVCMSQAKACITG
jgi:hypothetical protein